MKKTAVCVLLALVSGLTLGLVRDHYFINEKKTWSEAQDYCRQHYHSNLSSIRNQEENDLLKNKMELDDPSGSDDQSWIGYNYEHFKGWKWSDGTQSLYTNWAPENPDLYILYPVTAMNPNGKWENKDGREPKTFFCSWWHHELILVTERLMWEEALLHCRERYTDLASVLTPEEATHLADGKPVENRTTEQVWTSLRYLAGQWLWVSERHAATQEFTQGSLPSCPAEPYSCGARVPGSGLWENRDCQERLNFLCYRA